MSEWYSDLTPEEMAGKHVRVQFDNGIVFEGPLVYDELDDFVRLGPMRNVPCTEGLSVEETGIPPVLTRSSGGHWYPFSDVKSIELVWDEREWEQLCPDDADIAERVVIRGRMWRVLRPDEGSGRMWVADGYTTFCVDSTMVSAYLRARSSAPVYSGFYRDVDGKYWLNLPGWHGWYCLDPGETLEARTPGQMEFRMPLTPVEAEFKEVD